MELASAYLDWKNWASESFGQCNAEESAYYAAETGFAAAAPRRVLEIGFGNGPMLGWLRGLGADVFGVEANPHLVALARKLLGDDHAFTELSDPALRRLAGSFTHVIAIDVLEHVPQDQIGPMLAEMGALLAPEGRIIARFPNGDSPFGRIHQHGDPTHVTTIGRAKLEYFARRAGLSVLELREPALQIAGSGFRRALRRRLLRIARAAFERLVSLLYFGGQRVPLSPNYVAVLARAA